MTSRAWRGPLRDPDALWDSRAVSFVASHRLSQPVLSTFALPLHKAVCRDSYYCFDALHLNNDGYLLLAAQMRPHLQVVDRLRDFALMWPAYAS